MRIDHLLRLLILTSLVGCAGPEVRLLEVVSVVNWYPSGNATCIPTDTTVWITFSDVLDAGSINDSTVMLMSENVAIEVERTYDDQTSTIRLAPTRSLAYGTEYLVRLDSTLSTSEGEALSVQVESTFTTVPQQGCSEALDCLVDDHCTAQICSVVGLCVDECVVPEDCDDGQLCAAGTCQ